MNQKALHTLEYDKITALLAGKAISVMGKERAQALLPTFDLDDIRQWQAETTESANFILRKGSLPLGGIRDIRPSLIRAEMDGVLSIEELLHVNDFLYVCRKAVNYSKFEGKADPFEILDPLFAQIETVPSLERELTRCIVGEKELADDASPKLSDIRRSIKVSNDRIKEQLNGIIHSQTYKNMLQDAVITIRGGRYCVPVRQEYRNAFPGMIHDQSSTGATLFIEPMSVVQLNNKIKELHAEEKTEIEAILRKLSQLVAEHSGSLTANVEMLAHLDFLFAKGELSLLMRGTEPVFNTAGYVNIIKARHPLLNPETVVPTDIWLGRDFSTLLITGPNTGGKTVSLKTLGLFSLMGQAGLHIPAFDRSELTVFDNVFADIGDEQSIEQSLSTFSGHMTNIVSILSEVTDSSLVLLDELGAGTDPTEGAALAVAIIEYLHDRKIRTAVTTHYSELKVYALSKEGVENAACEFSVETLRPTYRLLIGIPGKSNAFAISRRLGLPEHVIDAAKEVLSQEDERFEDILTDLEINRKSVIIEKERAEQFRRDAEVLKKEFEKQKARLDEQKAKILTEARNEALRITEAAKSDADGIIREMQKLANDASNHRTLDDKRRQLREKLTEAEEAAYAQSKPQKKLAPITRPLVAGDRVFIQSLGQTATVMQPPDAGGDMTVEAGIMKVRVNITAVVLDESREEKKPEVKPYAQSVKKGKAQSVSASIDLRGNMVAEALESLDKYLDDAYLSGLKKIEIIHGKGTGALRSAVQTHLKTHPHVVSHRLGVFGEGEDGVTIAELK